ncbi:LON peptidase N-terminal domain and RING finger protein 1-like [Punica granatum]|uniref:RING-type domain-containing protein n=2 Tax=Punica granatum TaxID=22663 RepID=A0A218XDM2_PUNGR|nr:LON peptidase N-terminal domain and RING finger protein 1-like [Punica granatum]OWM82898.1 hypothetical protein CDL15_Pgr005298 [Punica granatum]PKI64821.1 hypothetical protein CRG98_014817 [Punica granatum]
MSTRAGRSPPLRGYRRKKTLLNLDLNTPPVENPEQEGTSTQATPQPVNAITTIDVEAIDDDDDVVFCSPSAFAEAKSKSQRNRGRATIVDVDTEAMTHGNKRRRIPAGQPSIDCDHSLNLEGSGNSLVLMEKPAPPPKEPTFTCPICMGPLIEETSTKCGHIFCKACIREAIASQAKCPTCRKRVTVRELIRVFLPATNLV